MKYDCDVIRDLLPLYADKACSERSREMVEGHLEECPDCRNMVGMLLDTEIEESLAGERESVLDYSVRQFKRRAAVVGSAVSGAITLP
ncbi:MAG: zf-HC2 domain-containing protein, partial [Oscillospiraceae bacterium]|nr:zf-HC2 domain-containing protein [Oscillospiraceae bacterium]